VSFRVSRRSLSLRDHGGQCTLSAVAAIHHGHPLRLVLNANTVSCRTLNYLEIKEEQRRRSLPGTRGGDRGAECGARKDLSLAASGTPERTDAKIEKDGHHDCASPERVVICRVGVAD